jgi:DNA repair exonuclease SbcCD nuclease subunit
MSTVDKVTMKRAGSTFRFVVAGDFHLSSETPRSRRDDFQQAVLGKLAQIQNIAAKKDTNSIILTGDIFNTKNISNPFIIVLLSLLQQHKEQRFFSIIGNHDIYYDKLSSITSSPLGILYVSRAINRLGVITITDSGDPVDLTTLPGGSPHGQPHGQDPAEGILPDQPWLVIKGFDYVPNLRLDTSGLPASALKIAVIHAFAGEDKAFMPEQSSDWISREALAYSGFDWVIAGHDHVADYFTFQNPETGQTVNVLVPGSVTRGTKHSFRRDQEPYVWLFEALSPKALHLQGGQHPITVEKVVLDVAPMDEVFSVEKIEREDVDKKIVDFVQTLQEVYTHKSGIYEVLDQLIGAGPIKTLVENYLTECGILR